jgi:hypothetical protein
MVEVKTESMVGGTVKTKATPKAKPFHEWMIQVQGAFQCLRRHPCLTNIAMLAHRQGHFFLDSAFALIEGHPGRRISSGSASKKGPRS